MNNLGAIKDQLQQYNLDGILLTGPVNRRWATGFYASAGVLVVTRGESLFITDSRYIESAEAKVQGATVAQIGVGESYPGMVEKFLTKQGVRRLGFEQHVMSQSTYADYSEKLSAELVPAEALVADLREVKSAEEYAIMRQAQVITDKAFADVLSNISPNMTEQEVAAELVYHLMKHGGEKPSFDPIVVGGPRSSMPHGKPGPYKLEGFVTIDFGAVYQGYCSDMTRTISIGEPTEEMRIVYETVLRAQLAGISAAKAGMIGRDIDKAARDVIEAAGYGDYFGHGLGHSLGLEVHESLKASPIEGRPIPKGAIISIEPGIYLPGQFGVRIEDVVCLTGTGCENLTATPKELTIIG
ncbi:MAG: Xaa-Pro peptidase family protein [Oscillospiraceae bacterium]|nr:Xaa-Pro peptidase family protein [Oscillospiraceae bacterium]